jgi:hypothetical protein
MRSNLALAPAPEGRTNRPQIEPARLHRGAAQHQGSVLILHEQGSAKSQTQSTASDYPEQPTRAAGRWPARAVRNAVERSAVPYFAPKPENVAIAVRGEAEDGHF